MKLTTIWTISAMTTGERIRRTADLAAQKAAAMLPRRVRYWAFIQAGASTIADDEIVPDARFMDLLQRLPR